jgi:hypothetical protein
MSACECACARVRVSQPTPLTPSACVCGESYVIRARTRFHQSTHAPPSEHTRASIYLFYLFYNHFYNRYNRFYNRFYLSYNDLRTRLRRKAGAAARPQLTRRPRVRPAPAVKKTQQNREDCGSEGCAGTGHVGPAVPRQRSCLLLYLCRQQLALASCASPPLMRSSDDSGHPPTTTTHTATQPEREIHS